MLKGVALSARENYIVIADTIGLQSKCNAVFLGQWFHCSELILESWLLHPQRSDLLIKVLLITLIKIKMIFLKKIEMFYDIFLVISISK